MIFMGDIPGRDGMGAGLGQKILPSPPSPPKVSKNIFYIKKKSFGFIKIKLVRFT